MSGLIEEIQRDSLSTDIQIETLLRRVKLAAAKLQLNSLGEWVEQELIGYVGEVPEYRKAHGHPVAWNPYNGWIPVHVANEQVSSLISVARIGQSISSLRDLLENESANGQLSFPVSSGLVAKLNEIMNFQTPKMAIQISRGNVVGILDHVRNMVLDWAIEMERQGVVGQGLSFSVNEREEAKQVMANFNVGSIGSFIGNMGSGNTSSDINASGVSVSQILEVTDKIKAMLSELENAGADGAALTKTIGGIEAEAEREKPDQGKLQGLLSDARLALVGATGNLTAEGAIAGISGLLKMFGGS